MSPKEQIEHDKREIADELRRFKESLHHKKHAADTKRMGRYVSNEAKLAKVTEEYLEELRRRRLGLGPKTPPKPFILDEASFVFTEPDKTPVAPPFVVDESDFRVKRKPLVRTEEKQFTLVSANGIMMKCYIGGNSFSSVPPRRSRDVSQDSSGTSSTKPTFTVGREDGHDDRVVERSKVQFRMKKYWDYRVRTDFSPKPNRRKQESLILKNEESKTPVAKKFELVKLSDLSR